MPKGTFNIITATIPQFKTPKHDVNFLLSSISEKRGNTYKNKNKIIQNKIYIIYVMYNSSMICEYLKKISLLTQVNKSKLSPMILKLICIQI